MRLKARGIYAGAAQSEKLKYLWLKGKKGEEVLIPRVNRFGDYHLKQQKQLWHDLPPGTAMKGVLMPETQRKDGSGSYRLLKVQTRAATPEEEEIVGNDRMPVTVPWPDAPDFEPITNPKRETKSGRAEKAAKAAKEALPPKDTGQMELF